jgi:hypothetical protein
MLAHIKDRNRYRQQTDNDVSVVKLCANVAAIDHSLIVAIGQKLCQLTIPDLIKTTSFPGTITLAELFCFLTRVSVRWPKTLTVEDRTPGMGGPGVRMVCEPIRTYKYCQVHSSMN